MHVKAAGVGFNGSNLSTTGSNSWRRWIHLLHPQIHLLHPLLHPLLHLTIDRLRHEWGPYVTSGVHTSIQSIEGLGFGVFRVWTLNKGWICWGGSVDPPHPPTTGTWVGPQTEIY